MSMNPPGGPPPGSCVKQALRHPLFRPNNLSADMPASRRWRSCDRGWRWLPGARGVCAGAAPWIFDRLAAHTAAAPVAGFDPANSTIDGGDVRSGAGVAPFIAGVASEMSMRRMTTGEAAAPFAARAYSRAVWMAGDPAGVGVWYGSQTPRRDCCTLRSTY